LRKTWKEAGLTVVNFLIVSSVIVGSELWLQKHFRAGLAPVSVVVCVGTYLAACRWIERRTPAELALPYAPPELGIGMLGGLGLFSLTMAILWGCAVYHPSGWGSLDHLGGGFVPALLGGVIEEILFRGLLFRLIAKVLGTWGALALTAAFFGFAHLANHGATAGSAVAIALEAGVLLGAAYALTTRLWLPIGLHFAWNFTEGSIVGMTLSGNTMASGVIRGSLSGPRILTGGEFGPEASIVAVIVCFAAALYMIYRIVKLHVAEPPVWSKPSSQVAAVTAQD
jgi:CAAX protease family protein